MMHKQRKISATAQAGFTLIELIVVIVILGILAATALPRFASLGADARVASLNAARGALQSTAAMAHGKFVTNASATALVSTVFEGATITYNTTSGYPSQLALGAAAGLTGADYVVFEGVRAADINGPVAVAGQLTVIPNSVAGTAKAGTCFIQYSTPTTANTAPTITAAPVESAC